MVSSSTYGFAGGFAQGAAAGSVFGPWGAAVGGVIGGLFGKKASDAAEEAKMYRQNAMTVQTHREQNAVEAQYLQMLREARTTRAGSLQASVTSGLTSSSLSTSALSSIGSQAQYNVQYLAEDRRLFKQYSNYLERAGELTDTYQNTMSMLQALPGITAGIKSIGGLFTSNTPEPWQYSRQTIQGQ